MREAVDEHLVSGRSLQRMFVALVTTVGDMPAFDVFAKFAEDMMRDYQAVGNPEHPYMRALAVGDNRQPRAVDGATGARATTLSLSCKSPFCITWRRCLPMLKPRSQLAPWCKM